jgi:hypothetical protein
MENDIKIINKGYSQEVVLTLDGISKVIYKLENVDTDYYCNFIRDGNYIIIFTSRVVDEEDPAYMTRFNKITAVYDLSTNETLELTEDTLYRIHDMYLTKTYFSIEIVLSLLTGRYFTLDKPKVAYFKNYITSFNENITDEEIRKYIISCYPELANFQNIKSLLLNRRKINDVLHQDRLSFRPIKQDIKEYSNFYEEKNKQFRKKYMSY